MAQNMLVQANALGLASCPMKFHDQDRARKVLGLPDDLSAPMGVAVGHPGAPDPGTGLVSTDPPGRAGAVGPLVRLRRSSSVQSP